MPPFCPLGTATLISCTLRNDALLSQSVLAGGGIENEGTATLTNCTLANDTAATEGGGIINNDTATLTNCTLSNDISSSDGGSPAIGQADNTQAQATDQRGVLRKDEEFGETPDIGAFEF